MPADELRDLTWWSKDRTPEERAKAAFEWARRLEKHYGANQRAREQQFLDLYESQWKSAGSSPVATVTNVIWQVVDSVVSDVTRDPITVQFQTRQADWPAQDRASLMAHVVDTDFEEARLNDDEGIEFCRDGFVLGEGVIKTTIDYESERLIDERIRSSHVFADARDARYGRPRCWGYFEHYAPEVLSARYPKHKDAIDEAELVKVDQLMDEGIEEGTNPGEEFSRRIMVYELWHLPSGYVKNTAAEDEWTEGSQSHDGRHMMLIGTKIESGAVALVDEPWPLEQTLLTFYRPMRAMRGWHGFGFAERLLSTQEEINKWEARIAQHMNLYARLYATVDKDSDFDVSQLTNDVMGILQGKGDPRAWFQLMTPPTVPGELPRRVEQLIQRARDFSGKNELAMSGKKPAGIESGIALEYLIDQESIRNSHCYKRYERARVDLARLHIDCYQLLATRKKGFKVAFRTQEDFGRIPWSDISLERDRYWIRPAAVNALPKTPAAQIDGVTKLVDKGLIPPTEGMRMLGKGYADIAAVTAPESAALDCIEAMLSDVVKKREMTADNMPKDFMDVVLAHRRALAKLNRARADGVDADIQLALVNWVAEAKKLVDELKPTTTPGGPGAPVIPGMNPAEPAAAALPLPGPGVAPAP